jgi:hypothetical protein
MRGKASTHIKALRFNGDHDPWQIKPVGLYDPKLIARHIFFDANRSKGMPYGGLIQLIFCRFRLKTDKPIETANQHFPVSHPFRDDAKIIARIIAYKQSAVTVENHASERRNILEMNAIVFRTGSVGRPVYNLKEPQPQNQETKYDQHKQGSAFELPGKDFNG